MKCMYRTVVLAIVSVVMVSIGFSQGRVINTKAKSGIGRYVFSEYTVLNGERYEWTSVIDLYDLVHGKSDFRIYSKKLSTIKGAKFELMQEYIADCEKAKGISSYDDYCGNVMNAYYKKKNHPGYYVGIYQRDRLEKDAIMYSLYLLDQEAILSKIPNGDKVKETFEGSLDKEIMIPLALKTRLHAMAALDKEYNTLCKQVQTKDPNTYCKYCAAYDAKQKSNKRKKNLQAKAEQIQEKAKNLPETVFDNSKDTKS